MCHCRLSVLNPFYRKAVREGWMTREEAMILPDSRITVPCGKCRACVLDKARAWRLRLLAEFDEFCESYGYSPYALVNLAPVYFFTLTVDEAHRASVEEDPSSSIRFFLESYRARFKRSFRHWICVEYGDPFHHTGRIHFHGIAFGLQSTFSEFRKLWTFGSRVDISRVKSRACMTYVSKYVTKYKVTNKAARFAGKCFASSGIGSTLLEAHSSEVVESTRNMARATVSYRNFQYPVPYYYVRKFCNRVNPSIISQRRILNAFYRQFQGFARYFALPESFYIRGGEIVSQALRSEVYDSLTDKQKRYADLASLESNPVGDVGFIRRNLVHLLTLFKDYVFDCVCAPSSFSSLECALRAL